MAEIVNLRRFRKQKARAEQKQGCRCQPQQARPDRGREETKGRRARDCRTPPRRTPHRTRRRVSKRSITIAGHRTSISLEAPFWEALTEIAASRDISVPALVAEIDRERADDTNLSAALRIFALGWYRRPSERA